MGVYDRYSTESERQMWKALMWDDPQCVCECVCRRRKNKGNHEEMSWQLEKTLNKVRLGPKSLTVCLLQLHHLLRLTVAALELHGRRLQSGVWADKLKTLVLLFICSCSFCKPEQTSPPITHTCTHTHTHLVIYLSGPQILLLLSFLIFTKHLRSDWLDSFPVIMREETGVRGRSLLSLAPRTNPRLRTVSAQIVFVLCVYVHRRGTGWVCVCVCV